MALRVFTINNSKFVLCLNEGSQTQTDKFLGKKGCGPHNENKTGFRPISRQQQDRFLAAFFGQLFMPAFWPAFLSTQYKRRAILSMQYKSPQTIISSIILRILMLTPAVQKLY